MNDFMASITDEQLFRLAKRFGWNALLWRKKFVGLLPEIHRRRIWEKKNFGSIFEFAKKLAGLSEKQVRLALNLEKRFMDKPELKKLLTSGEVSVNKLARVVSIATPENDEKLATAVKMLPKDAIETFVRDEKFAKNETEIQRQNGFIEPKIEAKSLPGQRLLLNQKVTEKLLELQEKGVDINEMILKILEEREGRIEEEKETIAKEMPETNSRYVPVKVRKIIAKEYGEKCSISGCKKKSEQLHHTQTFALSKKHDPRFLAPLCKAHHVIAHGINVKFFDRRLSR